VPADPPSFNCTLTPETTEGPYWVDERLERADIVAGQPGVPLALQIGVHEMPRASRPYRGAMVDVWQANALGLYSAEPDQPGGDTGGETFLRGYQVTGEDGEVRFQTIFPGWYEGRTLHIHVRLRVFTDGEAGYTFTTQIFFDESINEAVLASSPYDQRPGRDTTNSTDGIFLPELVADLSGDPAKGYRASFAICLQGMPPQGRP
jgi:protocatechuate 3,4-dioxygenase beta subunit